MKNLILILISVALLSGCSVTKDIIKGPKKKMLVTTERDVYSFDQAKVISKNAAKCFLSDAKIKSYMEMLREGFEVKNSDNILWISITLAMEGLRVDNQSDFEDKFPEIDGEYIDNKMNDCMDTEKPNFETQKELSYDAWFSRELYENNGYKKYKWCSDATQPEEIKACEEE